METYDRNIAIESVSELKLKLLQTAHELRSVIIDIVKNHGGYLNTANNDGQNDNIYGAIYYDSGAGELVEVQVKALQVTNGQLSAYCVPVSQLRIEYNDEDMKADIDSWYWIDVSGSVQYLQMLHAIADVLEYGEYL